MAFTTLDGNIEDVHPAAHALRPARLLNGELRHYTGTTFPDGPRDGCLLSLRRLEACGLLSKNTESNHWIDVLDQDGGILQEVPLTRQGFEYLRTKFEFKLDS